MQSTVVDSPAVRRARRLLLALPLAAALACGEDDILPPPSPVLCSGSAAARVGPGTTPMISWSPSCAVHRIQVVQSGDAGPREVWHVRRAAGIVSGVRYGGAIAGATVVVGPEALVAGRAATLVLLMEVDGSFMPIGGASFTP